MASNFIYSTKDHKFMLKEWLDFKKVLNYPQFKDSFGMEDIDPILDQAYKIAKDVLAPTNDDGEKPGFTVGENIVYMPESFHTAYKILQEQGWGAYDPKEDYIPNTLRWMTHEYLCAANLVVYSLFKLNHGVSKVIENFGDDKAKAMFLPKLHSGEWGGTMSITEPQSGSDAGEALTKAYPTDDSRIYKLKGGKCFISGSFQNITGNIINIVVARVEGSPPGTAGLSQFICPNYWVNEDGSMEPNDIALVSLEHKMGWKGMPCATLAYGDNNNCRAILVGKVNEGMKQMFLMMNGSRHGTAHQATTLGTVAYNNSVEYAKVRVQGKAITNPKGGRVRIIEHEDIRRMLLDQKATLDAMRSLVFMIVYCNEVILYSPDPEERAAAQDMIDILNPLAKAYCSDSAFMTARDAMQVYGGYGYSEEFPIARLLREIKILSIWEGTNYIQSYDLVARKFKQNNGEKFKKWMADIENYIETNQGAPGFENELAILNEAMQSYKEIYDTMTKYSDENKQLVAIYATRVLQSTAILYCGKIMAEQGIIAQKSLTDGGQFEEAYYQGKIASAKFYIRNTVKSIKNSELIIKSADTSAVEVPEDAF